ncbi:MAG: hypothetical protein DMG05_04865 [Acidobacteria bacterium]|nr:MAG: hypothetical protein DMG05_04865 [Acidobacteriota bacterium]
MGTTLVSALLVIPAQDVPEAERWEPGLPDWEGSVKLNTSLVERLNLTIRQGSAYPGRRTIGCARWKERATRLLTDPPAPI